MAQNIHIKQTPGNHLIQKPYNKETMFHRNHVIPKPCDTETMKIYKPYIEETM